MNYPVPVILHASTVAVEDDEESRRWRALLILGASGSGKSGLALALMAMGARLVSDDRTIVTRVGETLWASAPPATAGLIEARGIGILPARALDRAPIVAALSRDIPETDRLPPDRTTEILGLPRPLLHNSASQHFAAAILHYLSVGRKD